MLLLVAPLCCWICGHLSSGFVFPLRPAQELQHCFSLFLLYLSASINPIFYAFTNGEFQREFRKLLCCRRERSRIVPKKAAAFTGNDLVEREEQEADFLSLMNLCWWNIIF